MKRPPGPDPALQRLFDELNRLYFEGRLHARVEWSTRMRVVAGSCDWQRGLIRLAWRYHQERPEQLRATLLHEMLHLHLRRGHDAVFKAAAARLGVPLHAPGVPEREPYRYVYACPACGRRILRRRRGTWSCGACSGGRYDARFQLRLLTRLSG